MYKQAVGFWDAPRHIALRVRYQLVGGLLFAIGVPLILRMLFVPEVLSSANHQVTVTAAIVAHLAGYLLYRRLGTYPGFAAAGAILPTFAFVNAGVSLEGVNLGTFAESVPLGIALGLVAGKAIGVFCASWLIVKLAGASLPAGASTRQFFAVCLLCGVGFTMSLFIGGLAFEGQDPAYETQLKLGVLGGSLVSALLGVALMLAGPKAAPEAISGRS
mgnify:CR=1 FL=1